MLHKNKNELSKTSAACIRMAEKLDKKYTSTGDISYARLAISAYNTAVKSNKVLLEGERMETKKKRYKPGRPTPKRKKK